MELKEQIKIKNEQIASLLNNKDYIDYRWVVYDETEEEVATSLRKCIDYDSIDTLYRLVTKFGVESLYEMNHHPLTLE